MFDINATGPVPTDLATRTEFSKVLVPLHQLLDAVVENGGQSIEGYRFTDCVIRGPAVIIPGAQTQFVNSNLGDVAGNVRNLFLRAAGPMIMGAIGVNRCVFDGCLFVGIGFAGDDAFVDNFSAQLSPAKA